MIIRILGAVFIILGCGGFGFLIAHNARRETMALRQFISALEFMECELNYRLTPLPQLCRQVSTVFGGCIGHFFLCLSEEMELQSAPHVERCVLKAIRRCPDIPGKTCKRVIALGQSLGLFDLEGQIKCIRAINRENLRILELDSRDQNSRLRSYKTLGLCAGAALVILFI